MCRPTDLNVETYTLQIESPMKQLSTLVEAIATFCCSPLLQAQTLDDLVNLDALLACECELVLEPVCVDLGVGVTFPAHSSRGSWRLWWSQRDATACR